MNLRKERGLEIAKHSRIVPKGDCYLVPSQTTHKSYTVRIGKEAYCDCPDFAKRGEEIGKCKHIFAVEIKFTKQKDHYGNTTITQETRVTYSQDWNAYDKSQTSEKETLMKLLNDLCEGIEELRHDGAGRPSLPIRDMIFSSTLKVYTTFSLRRFVSDMQMAQEKGYMVVVPHYSRVARYMKDARLTPILEGLIKITSLPLSSVETNFAIDSSGFSTSVFSRWFDFRYGRSKEERMWVKTHIMVGTKTNIITAVRLTGENISDTVKFGELVNETAENFQVKEVSADKGYSSRENMETVENLGGTPFIMFRKSTNPTKRDSPIWKKMYHYFSLNQEEFMEHYHKRSNVETTFSMIKRKFGGNIRSKEKVAQINEVLLKVLCHNICVVIQEMNELGITPNFMKIA